MTRTQSIITFLLFIFCELFFSNLFAQSSSIYDVSYPRADSLKGHLTPLRSCYDVTFYLLDIEVFPNSKSLSGSCDIHFKTLSPFKKFQIDLAENLNIDHILFQGQKLKFKREYGAVFVDFPDEFAIDSLGIISVHYSGQPRIAKNAPWDGGFVWKKDKNEKPWIGVACEGEGASLWWPNKDHLSDEPDSIIIKIKVPEDLMAVSNGNLIDTKNSNKKTTYSWKVSYPINNYNVSINIADYVHFRDSCFAQDKTVLPLDYYVLKENEAKARKQFKQVPVILAAFEYYFDKYPFWEDGFALIETPYLGMEHQSGIAYGNKYMRGYLGGLIPSDMNFDYIIVHETGHEWFGNSISCQDRSEMWIHESFTTYMEALYVEYVHGYKDYVRYLESQKKHITNKAPIIGPEHVHFDGWESSDHYYKGSWVLHSLRSSIDDDDLWRDILKTFYTKNAYSIIQSEVFYQHVKEKTGKDYSAFFKQYLHHSNIPKFVYELKKSKKGLKIKYKWECDVKEFDMPIKIGQPDKYQTLFPTTDWQTTILEIEKKDVKLATELFLIEE